MDWESPNCNFCGSSEKTEYLLNPDRAWYEGKPFRIVKCSSCRLVYADPRPLFDNLLKNYMKTEGWPKKIFYRKKRRPQVDLIHRNIVREALALVKAESLFDVGTGAGTLLEQAQKLGLKVAGNEINTFAANTLTAKGIPVYNLPTQQLQLKQKFDIVMMLDYLEHTYTPFDDLKWAYEHLNTNGILYLKTLYLNCPNHKTQGKNWNLFEAGHFHFFFPSVLKEMMIKAGFTVLTVHSGSAIIKMVARRKEGLFA